MQGKLPLFFIRASAKEKNLENFFEMVFSRLAENSADAEKKVDFPLEHAGFIV